MHHVPGTRLRKFWKPIGAALIAATVLCGMSVASPALTRAEADALTGSGGQFVPVQGRILDTRAATSVGGYSTPMPANTWRSVQVTGQAGISSTAVAAVEVSFSVVNDPEGGYLKADKDETTPSSTIAYMYWIGGQPQSNTGLVAVGTNGRIDVKTSSSTDLIIDVEGYYTSGDPVAGGFVPVAESRIVDTRSGTGLPAAQLTSGSISTIQIGGVGGVPADASAVMLNFAVLDQSGRGNLIAYPADGSPPQQYLPFGTNGPDATSAAVALSSSGSPPGEVNVQATVSGGGTLDLVVDVLGYFTADQSGGAFTPAATRIYDSRSSGNTWLAADATRTVQIVGVSGVPASGLGAVAMNIDIFDDSGSSGSWVHVWPDAQAEPSPAMALHYDSGGTTSNLMTVALGADGGIKIHNMGSDSIDFALDVEGWYQDTPMPIPTSSLCVQPSSSGCTSGDGESTATPTLSAATTDLDAAALRYDFEVWDAVGQSGAATSIVASGSVDNLTSGVTANWQIPANMLTSSTSYQYRVRAYNGLTYSPWSDWYVFTVDYGPSFDDVSSSNYTEYQWTVPSSSPLDLAVVTDPEDPAVSVTATLDGDSAQTAAGADASFGFAAPSLGVHTVVISAIDSQNQAATYEYNFSVGSAPEPPSSLSVTPEPSALSISWDPPTAVHGAPVSGYDVTLDDATSGATIDVGACTSCMSTVVSSLNPIDEYAVNVVALSDAGTSSSETSAPIAPLDSGSSADCDSLSRGDKCWNANAAPEQTVYSTLFPDGSRINTTDSGAVSATPASDGSSGLAGLELSDETSASTAAATADATISSAFDTPAGFVLDRPYVLRPPWVYYSHVRHQQLVKCADANDWTTCDYDHPLGNVDVRIRVEVDGSGHATVHQWLITLFSKRTYGPEYYFTTDLYCGVNVVGGRGWLCNKNQLAPLGHKHFDTMDHTYQATTQELEYDFIANFGTVEGKYAKFPMVQFNTYWLGHAYHDAAKLRGYDTFYAPYMSTKRWRYIRGRTGYGK